MIKEKHYYISNVTLAKQTRMPICTNLFFIQNCFCLKPHVFCW